MILFANIATFHHRTEGQGLLRELPATVEALNEGRVLPSQLDTLRFDDLYLCSTGYGMD